MIFVGDLGTQAVVISDVTTFDVDVSPTPASAQYSLTNAGQVITSVGVLGNWIVPQINMGDFECFATVTSGLISSGPTGSWVPLSTTRTWVLNRTTVGTSSATVNIRIRRVGTVIDLTEADITFNATVDP